MRFWVAILCLVLAACSVAQWNEKLSTPADRAMAQDFIAAMRAGNLASQQPVMDPKLFAQTLAAQPKVRVILPASGSPELVTVNTMTNGFGADAASRVGLNYQFGAGTKWVVFQVVLQKAGGQAHVAGWNVQPFALRPPEAGDFSLQGKTPGHYGWLGAMALSTGTILFALVQLYRSAGIRRRWLWAFVCAFGLVQFVINWSTGAWIVRPVFIGLLGSGFVRPSPFDPWYLTFSLPIGALVFLYRRGDLLARAAEAETD